ncbi:uncharacterized protein PV07_00642 [Cladophialophora immunda]|uniref:Uncharacterized protein n=2 Tax=Cladophialophora immunda TaxID=569365 RepID=A0A0D2B860_9EURO|nr:uncharacterized protein PV07_00642 [Cladophialophora immunda]KIW33822.1 hypothetical protein PV07_00642 [Cladophialophora immunda]
MEEDGRSLLHHMPPHGQPGQHGHSSRWLPDNLPQNTSPQESDHFTDGDSLENVALELYTEILLGRAHLLLFSSGRDDVSAQDNLFDRGKEVLEEAVSLCFSGQHPVSKALVAKCWYMKGFLADVSRDDENALSCFIQATDLDDSYKSLERVRWHLRRREDLEELFEAWDHPDGPFESQIDGYRLGEPDSDHDAAATPSSPTATTPNSRHSQLYEFLMSDINNTDLKVHEPAPGDSSSVFSPYQPHHLPPIATPHKAFLTDRVDQLVQEKINGPGAERRASQETREALKESQYSPVRDPFLLRVEENKKKAKLEAEERMHHIRAARARQSSAYSRRLSGQDPPLSDGLSIALEDVPGSARRLTINTRGIRRLSTSSKSSDHSPTLPSPLRKASLPGDAQTTADGS